jgi:hypothetical protein
VEKNLRYSSETSAADRIRRLVDKFDAGWLLSAEHIALAGNLRNYYTHFDPLVEKRLPPNDERFRRMHNLAVRLRTLCELILLDSVGFPREWVKDRLQSTRRVERQLVSSVGVN